jgi:hypothetical protein
MPLLTLAAILQDDFTLAEEEIPQFRFREWSPLSLHGLLRDLGRERHVLCRWPPGYPHSLQSDGSGEPIRITEKGLRYRERLTDPERRLWARFRSTDPCAFLVAAL